MNSTSINAPDRFQRVSIIARLSPHLGLG